MHNTLPHHPLGPKRALSLAVDLLYTLHDIDRSHLTVRLHPIIRSLEAEVFLTRH